MEQLTGTIIYYNQHGEGVAFYNTKPVYIYGTIKGEEIAHDVAVEAQQALLKELKDTYGKDKDKSQLIEIERVAKELRSHERFQKYR